MIPDAKLIILSRGFFYFNPGMEKPPRPWLGAPVVRWKGPRGNFLRPPRSKLGLLIAKWHDFKASDTGICWFFCFCSWKIYGLCIFQKNVFRKYCTLSLGFLSFGRFRFWTHPWYACLFAKTVYSSAKTILRGHTTPRYAVRRAQYAFRSSAFAGYDSEVPWSIFR